MGRPSKFDREEAIEIVMHDLWREGYASASVKAISEKLGITRSSFYNAFGSQEPLFEEILTRYCEVAADRELENASKGMPIKALFTRVLKNVCEMHRSNAEDRGCLVVNSIAGLCGEDGKLNQLMQNIIDTRRGQIEQALSWAVEQKEIPKNSNVQALALSLQTLMFGINILAKTDATTDQLWLTARSTLDALNLLEE